MILLICEILFKLNRACWLEFDCLFTKIIDRLIKIFVRIFNRSETFQ